MAAASPTRGKAGPRCMMSAARSSRRPRAPPGWYCWKFSGVKPRAVSRARARASPRPIIMVVEVVGAQPLGQASGKSGRRRKTWAREARKLSGRALTPITGTKWRAQKARMPWSSSVSPEREKASTASWAEIMPRSPWLASAG